MVRAHAAVFCLFVALTVPACNQKPTAQNTPPDDGRTLSEEAKPTTSVVAADKTLGQASKSQPSATPSKALVEARDLNSDKYATPPTQFRRGQVSRRSLDAKPLKQPDGGYVIELPSHTPIPTPTVYRGNVYVSGGFHSKEFYCFEAATGKLVWGLDLDDDGPTSSAADDDVIVFNTESCTIYAVDAKTGEQLWSHWLGDPLVSAPTIANGRVFTSYPISHGNDAAADSEKFEGRAPKDAPKKVPPPATHVLACLDLRTGRFLWQRWLDSDVMSTRVAADGELYVTTFAGNVYKFGQADGQVLAVENSRATSAPTIVGTKLYVSQRADQAEGPAEEAIARRDRNSIQLEHQGEKKLAKYLAADIQGLSNLKQSALALDAGNGFTGGFGQLGGYGGGADSSPLAANAMAAKENIGMDNVSTLQAFQGSRILHYAGSNFNCMGDELICSDPVNGTKKWSHQLAGELEREGGSLGSPPALAGGQLFLSTLKGDVLQFEPASGAVVRTFSVGTPIRAQPAIEDGRIFVGTQDGKLVCIDTGNKRFDGWPTWGANAAHTGVPHVGGSK